MTPTYYLDASFDALFFLGQHAMAGTGAANLAHTYSSASIERYLLNGIEMGEFGCRAALAGAVGVPTVFVSGDDKMMAEARALVPGIYGAQVKVGLAPQMALHMAPEDARDLIRDVAREATLGAGAVALYVLEAPTSKRSPSGDGRTRRRTCRAALRRRVREPCEARRVAVRPVYLRPPPRAGAG